MSPADSEGKCQCQHCDGKQSARGCLCGTVGVTSTIDKPDFQLGMQTSLETSSETKTAISVTGFCINNLREKEN